MNETDIDDAPVVKYVYKILLDAIEQQASEIHLNQVNLEEFHISLKINDCMDEYARPPVILFQNIVNRLRVMFRLDVYGPHRPLEGEMWLRLNPNDVAHFTMINPDANDRHVVVCFTKVHDIPEENDL